VLTAVFVVSSAVLFLFDRFSHPALPAYIVAGIIVGNFFPTEEMITFTQIGLSFLVFIFGVKMDPDRLSLVASDSLKTTLFQVTAVAAVAVAASWFLGLSGFETLVFVLATTLSSTLVGLDLLEDEIDLNLAHGRLAESIHLNQDVIAVVFLMVLGASSFTFGEISLSLFHGFTVIFIALFFRRYLMDHVASLTEGSRELMMLLSITVLAGFLGITELTNTSLAIGSFAAGLAVSRYPHNAEILDTTGSLRDFFSAIFFVSLGALLTIPSRQVLLLSGVMILLTTLFKPYTVTAALIGLGQNERTSYLTGFSIDQVSEFALIITIQAYLTGMISDTLFQSVIITATVSMMVSSYTAKHGDRMYEILSEWEPLPSTRDEGLSHELSDHVIVVGYDTQGERIVEKLIEEDTEFVVIDNDPEKISDLEEKEENFVYGDVMDEETWERACADEATLIISTAPLRKISERIIELETEADRILRSATVEEARELLREENVIYVSVPKVLSSELLLDHVEGIMENRQYREELRRENMLEIRRYMQDMEG
jgi:CPA2 family monovalent cation:H+ antiporter-2